MSASVVGLLDWSLDRDRSGNRDYRALWLVKSTSPLDGPMTAITASGLPVIGSTWNLGNDADPWVYCLPTSKVKRHRAYSEGEIGIYWTVEQLFQSPGKIPPGEQGRCNDYENDDPLLEPAKVSGSFINYSKEATVDRNGKAILSSCHQPITGLEVDRSRFSVQIERNTLDNDLDLYQGFIDTLNDSTLWGVGARQVKFSGLAYERKVYGSCYYYFTHRLEFEIRREGFDEDRILDLGMLEINPDRWPRDDSGAYTGDTPTSDQLANPKNFTVIRGPDGNPITSPVPLKNGVRVLQPQIAENLAYIPTVELYPESNFLELGIPTSLST